MSSATTVTRAAYQAVVRHLRRKHGRPRLRQLRPGWKRRPATMRPRRKGICRVCHAAMPRGRAWRRVGRGSGFGGRGHRTAVRQPWRGSRGCRHPRWASSSGGWRGVSRRPGRRSWDPGIGRGWRGSRRIDRYRLQPSTTRFCGQVPPAKGSDDASREPFSLKPPRRNSTRCWSRHVPSPLPQELRSFGIDRVSGSQHRP